MREALRKAGLQPSAVDYVSLHGTGTRANDAAEDRAVADVFGEETPCSSTKGWSGHTLGASGSLGVAIARLAIENDLLPGCLAVTEVDPAFRSRVLVDNASGRVRRVMTNSFGFGGVNCSRHGTGVMEVYIRSMSIGGRASGLGSQPSDLAGERVYEPRDRRHRHRRCCRPTSAAALARWRGSRLRWPRKRRRGPGSPRSLRSVFGSSNGDAVVVHDILEALTSADRPVSPTQFHNSVHNAAAGCWTIATGSHQPATSLGCHDHTLAASLLKAVAEAQVEQAPVLLCVYDVPPPAPLAAKRPTEGSFRVGFVLTSR